MPASSTSRTWGGGTPSKRVFPGSPELAVRNGRILLVLSLNGRTIRRDLEGHGVNVVIIIANHGAPLPRGRLIVDFASRLAMEAGRHPIFAKGFDGFHDVAGYICQRRRFYGIPSRDRERRLPDRKS